jgi:FkbM family methyltransferase
MGRLRSTLERLARGRVLHRRITVAGRSLRLLVSPDAQLKFWKPWGHPFDKDLVEIAEKFVRPNSNVWDIGANVGIFTFAAAAIASEGTVVAVEADLWLVSILRRSARMADHRGRDIRILPAAASESNSVATLDIAQRGRASNSLEQVGGRSEMGGTREKQLVPSLTLDTLLGVFPSPDFVKIDVEGAEFLVLRGASHLIEECRPVFYVEVGHDVSKDVLRLFERADYLAVDRTGARLSDRCAFNTLFIPSEDTASQRIAGLKE